MGQRPFILSVTALRRSPGGRRHEVRQGPLPGLRITSSWVPPEADVIVDAVLEAVDGGIVATGSVSAPFAAECRRCLGPVTGTVTAEVREVYEPEREPGPPVLAHDDLEETYPLHGDQLDLEPLARDAVLLELPLAPLCMEGCRGLCPLCGVNLNEGSCTCQAARIDPRWAGLDALRSDN
jgi:uncharacterized protein